GTKLRPELRIFVASALSIVVILLWAKFFAPKPPAQTPEANKQAATAPATAGAQSGGTASNSGGTNKPAAPATVAAAPPAAVKGDTQERTVVVENDLYRVEFSNRGGVVKSWRLKKYMDDSKPRQVLDLVHAKTSQEVGGWPFAVVLDDANLESTANSALYVQSAHDNLKAPADLSFSWSDGHLEITKRFHFDQSYVAKAEIVAKYDGKPLTAGLAWLGGFGDLTVTNPRPIETVNIVYSEGGKTNSLPYKEVYDWEKVNRGVWWGGKDWTGIEDRYFAAIFLPANGAAPGTLETRYWKVWHPVQIDGKDTPEPVPQIATATASSTELRVFVGP